MRSSKAAGSPAGMREAPRKTRVDAGSRSRPSASFTSARACSTVSWSVVAHIATQYAGTDGGVAAPPGHITTVPPWISV